MKVLSLQEPYATFIKEGFKKIETRSWKTNYRGKLLIHAGKSNKWLNEISDSRVKRLLELTSLNHGKIICQVDLVDCVYMDEQFIDEIKKNNEIEYLLGIYKVGRYAWILDNIKIIDNPIEINGKLNLWEFEMDGKGD